MKRAQNWLAAAVILFGGSLWAGAVQETPKPATPPAAEEAPKPPKPPKAKVRVAPAPMVWAGAGSGAYLGIDTRDVTSERKQALNLPEERGVEVTMVDKDAPAGKAGLRESDVIMEFNGERVQGVEHLRRLIRETPPGRTVSLGIIRGGQPQQVQATLADRARIERQLIVRTPRAPRPPRTVEIPDFEIPEIEIEEFDMPEIRIIRSATTGLVVENLTHQLGEFFGVPGGEGLLVKSVEKGSAAEAAGFRAGDVIVRVGKDKVTSRGTWRSALRAQRRTGGTVPVAVIRDKREVTLNLKLDQPRGEATEGNLLINGADVEVLVAQAFPLGERAIEMALLAAEEAPLLGIEAELMAREAAEEAEQAARELEHELQRGECPNRI